MKDRRDRIAKLESIFISTPLRVLATDPATGETVEETLAEMIERGHVWAMKVTGGNDSDGRDLSRLLDYFCFMADIEPGGGFITDEFKEKAKSEDFKARKAAKEAEIEAYNNMTLAEKMAKCKSESED